MLPVIRDWYSTNLFDWGLSLAKALHMKAFKKIWWILAASSAVNISCKGQTPNSPLVPSEKALPALSKQFACLPEQAAFIAAHRGTSKNSPYPENSMSGLMALIERGYQFAEIDVAALQDRTHILYHDDNWDDHSSGIGSVNRTSTADFLNIKLKDTNGKLTEEHAPSLESILETAKDRIYLEIDFKPSAKYEAVITAIRDARMQSQVILISYSAGQASKLARLAPEMMVSISAKTDAEIKSYENAGVDSSKMAVWRGRSGVNSKLLETLRREGIPILRQAPKSGPKKTTRVASVIVTDYAFNYDPIIGFSKASKLAYENCLKE